MAVSSGMRFGLAALAAVAMSASVQAAGITGAGSTFVYPILSKWSADYSAKAGIQVNYQSIGSGGGLVQIKAGTLDFGASDAPMKPAELQKLGMGQFPLVIGGIAPVVNIDGLQAGQMRLTGPLLADIDLGKVKEWNDPAIAKLNAKLKLPSDAITVVRRSDGSGTTFNFTDYLSKSNAEWKTKVGSGTAVEWPAGVGAKGNEGVAGNVSQTKNSIGYVEYAYAKQNKLTYAGMINKAGKTVQPTMAAFQAAASNADWAKAPGYYVILTDQPGEASWPITAATFILMHKEPVDKAASAEAIKFFKWAFAKGGKMAEELDYIPMPDSVVKLIEKTWSAEIKS
jgi:phosphate transport system substrate-binding protein